MSTKRLAIVGGGSIPIMILYFDESLNFQISCVCHILQYEVLQLGLTLRDEGRSSCGFCH